VEVRCIVVSVMSFLSHSQALQLRPAGHLPISDRESQRFHLQLFGRPLAIALVAGGEYLDGLLPTASKQGSTTNTRGTAPEDRRRRAVPHGRSWLVNESATGLTARPTRLARPRPLSSHP
jgi:hypothetical protein